jgi:hypothetical protein
VTNCRLSSASSALKFCDGNSNAIRRVAIDNIVITNSNRGIAFMVFDGGIVEDVVVSNVIIDTRRFDWFWWGDGDPIHFNIKRRSEIDGVQRAGEPKAGVIRNVTLQNIIAHGAGTSAINGHPDSWLDGVHFNNIRLYVARDPNAPYEDTRHAMTVRYAKGLVMKDVQVRWGQPSSELWSTPMTVSDIKDAVLEGLDLAALDLNRVDNVTVRNSAVGKIHVAGAQSRGVRVVGTDAAISTDPDVPKTAVGGGRPSAAKSRRVSNTAQTRVE